MLESPISSACATGLAHNSNTLASSAARREKCLTIFIVVQFRVACHNSATLSRCAELFEFGLILSNKRYLFTVNVYPELRPISGKIPRAYRYFIQTGNIPI